jgi:tRNA (guanine-N7-)-methyltransferase
MERMAQLTRVYIRRKGRMTQAQARALKTLLDRYELPMSDSVVDWTGVFGRAAPLLLEIGFGMGHALIDAAQRHPDWNCVGVEVYRPGIGALLNAISAAQITNIRIIEGDARDVLATMVGPRQLNRLIVFFPDPWPKSKHHKRRLVNEEFGALASSRLADDGLLLIATDWAHYAAGMMAVLDAEPGLENVAGAGRFSERAPERPVTRFEARGAGLGHAVWDLAYQRRRATTGNR